MVHVKLVMPSQGRYWSYRWWPFISGQDVAMPNGVCDTLTGHQVNDQIQIYQLRSDTAGKYVNLHLLDQFRDQRLTEPILSL